MSYLKQAISGISWMSALTGLTKVLAIVKIAVLARILSPSQFGSYGVALLVLGLLEVLTETGINIFLIQEKDSAEDYLDSAWMVSIIRGILISLLILVWAQFIAIFFKAPGVLPLLYLIAPVAFVRGFINPMTVFFQKNLEFKKVFAFQVGLYFVDAATAVTLGLITHSESSMIYGMLAAGVLEVILSFILFSKKPQFKFEKEKFLKVVSSGKWITGAGLFSYLFQNVDNFVVGKFLGTTSLGLYEQAYSIGTLPVSGVSDIFNKVMFPIFAKMADQKTELEHAFYKAFGVIVSIVVVFGIIILLFGHQIILIGLGPKWLVIEPTLKVLGIFGIVKSILNSSYSLFLSLKMQKTVMLSELFGIVVMGIIIYPAVTRYGIIGAGYSVIVAVICSLPVVLINVKKVFRST